MCMLGNQDRMGLSPILEKYTPGTERLHREDPSLGTEENLPG